MNRNIGILILAVVAVSMAAWSSPPANLSLGGLWTAMESGAQISSGTGALPPVGVAGARYTDLSTPTAPVDYRSDGAAWRQISGAGTGGGVSTHSLLFGLDFQDSGHTGFASEAALDDYQPIASMAEWPSAASLTAYQTTASMVEYQLVASMADYQPVASMSGYQPTASMSAYATTVSLSAHTSDQEDPHGASMTITQYVDIGTGPRDVSLCRISTGTLQIASRAVILESIGVGSSTDLATGIVFQIASGASLQVQIDNAGNATFAGRLVASGGWDDLVIDLTTAKGGLLGECTLATIPIAVPAGRSAANAGLFALRFDDGDDDDLVCSFQMPHGWVAGSLVHPHIHLMLAADNAAIATAVMEFEYALKPPTGGVGATQSVIVTKLISVPVASAGYMLMPDFGPVTMTGYGLSTCIPSRYARLAASSTDTLNAHVFAISADVHYQRNRLGSNQEYSD